MPHCKDFVEIFPVRETAEGFEPIFGDDARGSSRMQVHGPGDLSFEDNPAYVAGAYENLRHHQLRSELEAKGLRCAAGEIHRVRITPMVMSGARMTRLCQASGAFTENGMLPGLLAAAASAGHAAGATHVEIKIS